MDDLEEYVLRDGTTVSYTILGAVWPFLVEHHNSEQSHVLMELAQICHDAAKPLSHSMRKLLKKRGFLASDGQIKEEVRRVVANAARICADDVQLSTPVKQ